jgi:hypothetical protein
MTYTLRSNILLFTVSADVFLPVGNRTVSSIFQAADMCYSYEQAGMLQVTSTTEATNFYGLVSNEPIGMYFTATNRM